MHLIKYIWRNVKRNKLRTALTVLSIGFSIALLTVLHGYMAMQEIWGKESEQYNRIVVMSSSGFAGELPIAHVDEIQDVKGIKAATPYGWFGGKYETQEMPFAQFATDPKTVFNVWPEYTIAEDELEEFKRNRQACVVDYRLAAKWKWKKGDRINLEGTWYQFNPELVLVGTFNSPKNTDTLLFNRVYLDEGLKQKGARGGENAGTIFAKTESKEAVVSAGKLIDAKFASTANPTRTQSEAAFAQMFADMVGGAAFYIRLIGLIIVISLVLVTANAMAMSTRERTTEIAVLKAIGFTRSRVMTMVVGESCWIAVMGGMVGVGLGCLFLEGLHFVMSQWFPFSIVEMLGPWIAYLLIAAGGVGILSGLIPAAIAAQRSVIDGLRRVV